MCAREHYELCYMQYGLMDIVWNGMEFMWFTSRRNFRMASEPVRILCVSSIHHQHSASRHFIHQTVRIISFWASLSRHCIQNKCIYLFSIKLKAHHLYFPYEQQSSVCFWKRLHCIRCQVYLPMTLIIYRIYSYIHVWMGMRRSYRAGTILMDTEYRCCHQNFRKRYQICHTVRHTSVFNLFHH